MRLLALCLLGALAFGLVVTPAVAITHTSRPTIAEGHKFLGVNLATHYAQPVWTWDGAKLLSSHSGANWSWHNIGIAVSESDPYWLTYPTGKKAQGVFYSKMVFGVGVTKWGLPLGYDWTCRLATHCSYNGSSYYGEICDFNN